MIYYTSDLHLGNKNIIEYENRPWKTAEEMDAALIKNWNEVVKDDDGIFVLGDFCFKGASKAIEYLNQLNGHIRLIRGNHDHFMSQQSFEAWLIGPENNDRVECCGWYKQVKDEGRHAVLCHFPILYWHGMDDLGWLHLYGHMHSRPGLQHPHKDAYNVGVDVNNYKPVTLDQLTRKHKVILQKWLYPKHKYEDFTMPEGRYITHEEDMEKKVNCAQCGREVIYGSCYTSMEIHTNIGFGYAVCPECYEKEFKRRMANREEE